MEEKINLMEIGKLQLVKEIWSWGNVLQFEHIEYMPSPYGDEKVETELSVMEAKQLIKHLQDFIDLQEGNNNTN